MTLIMCWICTKKVMHENQKEDTVMYAAETFGDKCSRYEKTANVVFNNEHSRWRYIHNPSWGHKNHSQCMNYFFKCLDFF